MPPSRKLIRRLLDELAKRRVPTPNRREPYPDTWPPAFSRREDHQ